MRTADRTGHRRLREPAGAAMLAGPSPTPKATAASRMKRTRVAGQLACEPRGVTPGRPGHEQHRGEASRGDEEGAYRAIDAEQRVADRASRARWTTTSGKASAPSSRARPRASSTGSRKFTSSAASVHGTSSAVKTRRV